MNIAFVDELHDNKHFDKTRFESKHLFMDNYPQWVNNSHT